MLKRRSQPMNRNATNFFAQESTIDINRSMWKTNHNHKTTFNNGQLIPFFIDTDILPAMTIKNRTAVLCRMSTPKYPVMDNLYLDTYYFKVPIWTIWKNWKAFNGENESGAWAQTTEYEVPVFKTEADAMVQSGSLNDYFGIPVNVPDIEFNQFAVRAYCRVYNFWFRDQNLIAPLDYATSDDTITIDGTVLTGGTPAKVAKFHDYFSSCLPEPQKGSAVTTPLGTTAPVIGNGMNIGLTDGNVNTGGFVRNVDSNSKGFLAGIGRAYGEENGTSYIPTATDYVMTGGNGFGITSDPTKSGMIVDLTNATAATINALRLAFATQRILEKDARFGTRYHEIIRGQFGVSSPQASLHVPEYLGGNRIPLNIETVLQNSSTTDESPLGQTGAFSVSFDINNDFTKSFDEHCVLIGLCCIRADHTYQQGLARMWTRKRRLDYYWPSLAHIGNQPVYNYEIYAQGTAEDNEVFGYKEAWAEYKYKPNRISGELRSTYAQSLDAWHYGDDYTSLPVLSQEWIEEPTDFVDRTLLVQSSVSNQFIADFEIEQEVAAPMPVHCTPGLIDHF